MNKLAEKISRAIETCPDETDLLNSVVEIIYNEMDSKCVTNQSNIKASPQPATKAGLVAENARLNRIIEQNSRVNTAGQTAVNSSHGIKNVLQAVSGGADVVDHAFKINDTERAKRGWKILKRNLDRVRKLVLDMLAFSAESEPVFGSCHLNSLIESAIDAVRSEADDRNITITLQMDERIESVELDADKIYDVALNLALNAIDAIEHDTGKVEVVTTFDEPNGKVILSVTDNGCGIEDIEKIFLPFHTSKAKVGTGLGLPIVKKTIAQHNGTIEVESKPGEGTTFIVTLPTTQFHTNSD